MPRVQEPFGALPDGTPVELLELTNGRLSAAVLSYGGIITSLRVPDRDGRAASVVLGYPRLGDYLEQSSYVGALVGRYANRIAHGRACIAGRTCQLATNNGRHHLHGGDRGFDRRMWEAVKISSGAGAGIRLSRTSPDGEEHYPGTLDATVTYTITDRDELVIDYEARADAPTIVNLTQHSYFNLAGGGGESILDHELTLHAEHYTPVDEELIPTGEVAPVAGTPFDFRTPTPVGARLAQDDEQLRRAGGYDHNFVLTRSGEGLAPAAVLHHRASGRTLEVWTSEPGIQLYDGHLLDTPHAGLCLETQHFPDSPNRPGFPTTQLEPGQTYASTTVWRFGHR
jgi:aldose 1-epimerase